MILLKEEVGVGDQEAHNLRPAVVKEHGAPLGLLPTGYYSVTARYGTPQDFMYFVDVLHQNGIAVLVDWVPGHFPRDEQGLRQFEAPPAPGRYNRRRPA